jgi:hypothetical protein
MGDQSTFGGLFFSSCTGAFTASYAGSTGVLTAAHCPDSELYDSSYSTSTVTYGWGAYRDVQFNVIYGNTVVPQFYDGSIVRDVTDRYSRDTQWVGMYLCHYGAATGYGCGTLYSKTFQPTYTNACNGVPCASTWMVATGSSLRTGDGDSGGPWFVASTALGVHKGSQTYGTYVIYMAIDYIDALGVSLLIR